MNACVMWMHGGRGMDWMTLGSLVARVKGDERILIALWAILVLLLVALIGWWRLGRGNRHPPGRHVDPPRAPPAAPDPPNAVPQLCDPPLIYYPPPDQPGPKPAQIQDRPRKMKKCSDLPKRKATKRSRRRLTRD